MNDVNQQAQSETPEGNFRKESVQESSKSTRKRYFVFGVIAGLLTSIPAFCCLSVFGFIWI